MKRVSIILIDWSARESFHSIIHLNKQTVPRDDYEIIWVEYYDRRPKEIEEFVAKGQVDKWIVLNKTGMYFKHLLDNEGVLASEGEIIVITDSDAIFSPTFVESIVRTFDEHKTEDIVLYLDELRSNNPGFYPYPFENLPWDVILKAVLSGPNLWNWDSVAKKPAGLTTDQCLNLPIPNSNKFLRAAYQINYCSCVCATRKSIIEAGGFDEDESYHCLICGPNELGWRLVNKGFKEIWHQDEWLIHLYHPWAGNNEVIGEHSSNYSKTSLTILETGRTTPLVENQKIKKLRTKPLYYGESKQRGEVIQLGAKQIIKDLVSIVIPHAGPLEQLKKCMEDVKRYTTVNYEIVIAADKCDEETLEYLKSLYQDGVRLIINPEIMGATVAVNMGHRAAQGEYICNLNTNVVLVLGWLRAMKETLSQHPDYGWVALTPKQEWGKGFFAGASLWTYEAMQKVGLMDEIFTTGPFNDDDYLRRMFQAGYDPHIVPQPKVDHPFSGKTLVALHGEEARMPIFQRNQKLFTAKWGETGTAWEKLPVAEPVNMPEVSKINPDEGKIATSTPPSDVPECWRQFATGDRM